MTRTKDGKPAPTVVFFKKIDGTYYVVEAASDAKTHRNYVVSAYIKEAKPQALIHANNDPQDTSENVVERFASDNSIGGAEANVNRPDLVERCTILGGSFRIKDGILAYQYYTDTLKVTTDENGNLKYSFNDVEEGEEEVADEADETAKALEKLREEADFL